MVEESKSDPPVSSEHAPNDPPPATNNEMEVDLHEDEVRHLASQIGERDEEIDRLRNRLHQAENQAADAAAARRDAEAARRETEVAAAAARREADAVIAANASRPPPTTATTPNPPTPTPPARQPITPQNRAPASRPSAAPRSSPPSSTPPDAMQDTMERLQRLVDQELARLEQGEISELPPATMQIMDTLVRLRNVSSSPQNQDMSAFAQTVADALSNKSKRPGVSPADVKGCPHLTGNADDDPQACLAHFYMNCGFIAKRALPTSAPKDDVVALTEQLAFEHVALICDGPILTLYQNIMRGSINVTNPLVSSAPREATNNDRVVDAPGSHPVPKTWTELQAAILDCLMPSHSVEELALQLVRFAQEPNESIAAFTLRFDSTYARFEQCVERFTPGRSPIEALRIVLYRNAVVPELQCLARHEPPPQTMRDAVDQARRLEQSNLTGQSPSGNRVTVSAVSYAHPSTPAPISQQFTVHQRNRNTTKKSSPSSGGSGGGGGTGGSGGGGGGGGATNGGGGGGASRDNRRRSDENRPRCTYARCTKPLGHTYERCFQRKRDEGKRSGGGGGGKGGGGGGDSSSTKRPKKSDEKDP